MVERATNLVFAAEDVCRGDACKAHSLRWMPLDDLAIDMAV